MYVCCHCNRDAGSRPEKYFDIESGLTFTFHKDCFYGPVREAVVEEYVRLIMKISDQRRGKWNVRLLR